MQLSQKKLDPEQLKNKRKITEISIKTAEEYLELANLNYEDVKNQYETGQVNKTHLLKQKVEVVKANETLEKAMITLNMIDFAFDLDKKISTTIREHFPEEKKAVEKVKQRGEVKALKDGKISLNVVEGQFLETGDILCQIS